MSAHDQRSSARHAAPLEMPENHLDLVVTPGSIDPARQASTKTTLFAVIAMPLFFLLTFTLCYVSATHAPVPHHMAITIAGPADVTTDIADTIDERAENAFDLTATEDQQAARDAVLQRDADGAVIIDGKNVTTIVASGGNRLAVATVQDLGQQMATELGGTATVEDVAPLPSDDPSGSALFFFLVVCTVGGFLSITAISQALPRARTRSLVATAIGAAVLVPIIGFSLVSIFVDFGVTFASAMGVISIGMIYTFTVAMLSTLFITLAGQAAIFLQILILVGLNFPSAGGSVPGSMLDPFWQVVHASWLGSGAYEAMRSTLFFDGEGTGRWILQLLIWTAAAVLFTLLATILKKRRAAAAGGVDGSGPSVGTASTEPGTASRQLVVSSGA